ncbi:MAG: exo-alpha-sialidase, partial [Chloroflexia bacterium]|nr:exo-alpha-sialidase [Chloroflexia bacterium]
MYRFRHRSLLCCCMLILLFTTFLPVGASINVAQAKEANTSFQQPLLSTPKASTVLYADVQVDTSCAGSACVASSLAEANTTRKLAVGADGSIYATYWNATGIYVAKSTNRGQSFATPVRVTTVASQAEIGVSGDGTLYIIYGNGTSFNITKSINGGTTWSSPVIVGSRTASQTIHMAVDGDYIYAVNQTGTTLYRSSNGGATWNTTAVSTAQVFADIRVDPLTHYVYIFTDNPRVYWYVSTNRGVTLGSQNDTGKSVYYSTGALSSDGTNTYFYMAGAGFSVGTTNLERINLATKAVDTKTIDNTVLGMTRALAADGCGNIVSGSKQNSTNNLLFQYSTDAGTTFSRSEQVVAAGNRESVAINITNGDLLYLYEKNGHIYLTTYKDVFTAGSSCYVLDLSLTAVEFTRPGETPQILLTNTSSADLPIASIVVSGTAFILRNTCGASLAPGASCTVTISGTTVASEIVTITAGVGDTIIKKIPVNLGVAAAARPTATNTRTITKT